ncbi:hypothetical protein GCM10018789_59640 [Streptomyces werraensis]|nr:hypothetical protein GCM10018789_59640 [Streptomyces werraensis]
MTTTAQDILTLKPERTLDQMDANHDVHLDWTDYQKLADRYIQATASAGTTSGPGRCIPSARSTGWNCCATRAWTATGCRHPVFYELSLWL